jgi:hypothetical protein
MWSAAYVGQPSWAVMGAHSQATPNRRVSVPCALLGVTLRLAGETRSGTRGSPSRRGVCVSYAPRVEAWTLRLFLRGRAVRRRRPPLSGLLDVALGAERKFLQHERGDEP